MTSRQGRVSSTQSNLGNGPPTNGHRPPPSSLAVRIVRSRAAVVGRKEAGGKEKFDQLLQDFLREPLIDDGKIEENAHFVFCLTEAALDILLKTNPFAPDALDPQAADCLLAMQLTIEHHPEVLLFGGNYTSDEETPHPPLVLCLLPKMLSLITASRLEHIRESLHLILEKFVSSLLSKVVTWRSGASLLKLLRITIEELLTALDANSESSVPLVSTFPITIPSSQSLPCFWSAAEKSIALPIGYQMVIESQVQAQKAAIALIIVVNGICSSGFDSDSSWQLDRENWTLDCCKRFLNSCRLDDKHGSPERGVWMTYVLKICNAALNTWDFDVASNSLVALVSQTISILLPSDGLKAQFQLAKLLLLMRRDVNGSSALRNSCADRLIPTIVSLIIDRPRFSSLHGDLQFTFCLWMDLVEPDIIPLEIMSAISDIRNREIDSLTGDGIADILREIPIEPKKLVDEHQANQRLAKRQKTDQDSKHDSTQRQYNSMVNRVALLLSNGDLTSLQELQEEFLDRFSALSEKDKSAVLCYFGQLPCIGSGSSESGAMVVDPQKEIRCKSCDSSPFSVTAVAAQSWNAVAPHQEYKAAIGILLQLIESPEIRQSGKLRIMVAKVLRRLMNHLTDWEMMDWASSPFGRWCWNSFQSRLRELRISVAQTFVPYLRSEIPTALRSRNRVAVLDFLRTQTSRAGLGQQETLIIAWGIICRVCGETEFEIALLQLVRYLGHPHPLICGTAYNELLRLANDFDRSLGDIFRPFWKDVAPDVVMDLTNCPQKAQQLCDLLGLSVNELLLLTQTETVPLLVLTKRHDVLRRIAQARGPNSAVQDVLLQPPRNLAGVLSMLLLQQSDDTEQAAGLLLREIAPTFQDKELSVLVKVVPIHTGCEILKTAGEREGTKNEEAHHAFKLLAQIAERKAGQQKQTPKDALSSFLDTHILGIMVHFADVIDASQERQPIYEKRRALWAIGQLIALAQGQVDLALPQFRATLESAFQITDLVDDAFNAWVALLAAVQTETIEPLIYHTFSIIVQNWSSFEPDTQTRAHDTIATMLKKYRDPIKDNIDLVPSLSGISLLKKFGTQIDRLKDTLDVTDLFEAYASRCKDENATMVRQTLQELIPFLTAHQNVIHESAISQQPMHVIGQLSRSLLDASLRFKENDQEIPELCGKALGIIGCIDSNRVEAVREKREILMLSNFDKAIEVIDFVAYILETVLVESFRSAPTGKAQIYLAYVMQELLKSSGITAAVANRSKYSPPSDAYARWKQIPESVQSTLIPYLSSKYMVVNPAMPSETPVFPTSGPPPQHGIWLRTFVFYLLHHGKGHNAQEIFPVISRVILGHDLAIAAFMLPFVVQNVVVGGSDEEVEYIKRQLVAILMFEIDGLPENEAEDIKQCSENIFQALDYLSRLLQEKKRNVNKVMIDRSRSRTAVSDDFDELQEVRQISCLERMLSGIPAEIIARRAEQCGSYARALFHWERHIRQLKERASLKREEFDPEELYKELQFIYSKIDESDCIEGISNYLHILDPSQQVLEHKRLGRWTAALSWYEIQVAESPCDHQLQVELLSCLKAAGRYDSLLNAIDSIVASDPTSIPSSLPFAAEAAWMTGKWESLKQFMDADSAFKSSDFNVGIGKALLAMLEGNQAEFQQIISDARASVTRGFSSSTTSSLANAHSHMIKLHSLYEIEAISGLSVHSLSRGMLSNALNGRLDILGSLTEDKQYILGIRRAAMQLSKIGFEPHDLSSAWLKSSRLARKANLINLAYDAVLHATHLNDEAATIEHSRLLWKDGHHRKAIQHLQGAMIADKFAANKDSVTAESAATDNMIMSHRLSQNNQNILKAKTQLLLAKWMDSAGQSTSTEVLRFYQDAVASFKMWDRGHYYLGTYYNKVLDSEKDAPRPMQSESYLTGDCDKLVIENYLRSMMFGSKYLHRTATKVLSLWLDFGQDLCTPLRGRIVREIRYQESRSKKLDQIHKQIKRYMMEKLPPYIFYIAFAQIISRIDHPHSKVWDLLSQLISRITSAYPQQALWSVLAVLKSNKKDKSDRARIVLEQVKRNLRADGSSQSRVNLTVFGDKLSSALIAAGNLHLEGRVSYVSLERDLNFPLRLAPCPLVIPLQNTLTASLPTTTGSMAVRNHNPFPGNPITIAAIDDEVLVLNSLQKPRKLTITGSDGRKYSLLLKPKDDLRKDRRLLDFNAMIDRALKRDVDSSKRKLYIKTYAVTPLSEDSGLIEWVDGLYPLRDTIMDLHKKHGVRPDYSQIRTDLEKACADPVNGPQKYFVNKLCKDYFPVLHEWFVDTFPEPDSWFAARLRYTRSCAVMSIVGHVLGLGDRHGENILLERGSGGLFHVDFNCLFDKGLTFEKPELVPFRLTHNMVDAFGPYGYEGPFRVAAELTMKILRQYEETLITIMESNLYDPTSDFIDEKPKKKHVPGVPETAEEVLESFRTKLKGMLKGETVPLSVDGYVDALIRMAVDPKNLSAMYIGWCAFY